MVRRKPFKKCIMKEMLKGKTKREAGKICNEKTFNRRT